MYCNSKIITIFAIPNHLKVRHTYKLYDIMYRIIAHCDPYNARFHYHSGEVIKRDGATPVAWVIETFRTQDEACEYLWKMALEDSNERDDLSFEDDYNINDQVQSISDYEGIPIEEAREMFSWYKGEGVYYCDGHEPMLLKGGDSYSYDVMTYTIEDTDE